MEKRVPLREPVLVAEAAVDLRPVLRLEVDELPVPLQLAASTACILLAWLNRAPGPRSRRRGRGSPRLRRSRRPTRSGLLGDVELRHVDSCLNSGCLGGGARHGAPRRVARHSSAATAAIIATRRGRLPPPRSRSRIVTCRDRSRGRAPPPPPKFWVKLRPPTPEPRSVPTRRGCCGGGRCCGSTWCAPGSGSRTSRCSPSSRPAVVTLASCMRSAGVRSSPCSGRRVGRRGVGEEAALGHVLAVQARRHDAGGCRCARRGADVTLTTLRLVEDLDHVVLRRCPA